uniref:Accessory Sec system protein translocase subunit SecY2 n=1 Tax=Staphylococcus rostri TaxID=522262 RepID=A0A2K3YW74_9STAP|nr:accessory Sec system protein translocase subunit SecY2 [Staphylococcus rostri]PNZ29855.1 accessory Sec system protein translocase subunit SecY2 [Staphylococcus rostri]
MKNNLLHRILRQYEYKILYKRMAFTFLILFLYILGSRITVVHQGKMVANQHDFYQLAVSNVGGNIQTLNLFSLGLGPWLTGLVLLMLWRYQNIEKTMQQTRKERHYQEKLLALVLAIIQGYFIIFQNIIAVHREVMNTPLLLLIIVTGAMLLMWLADQNVRYGLAGAMPIILVSIIRSIFYQQAPHIKIDGVLLIVISIAMALILIILLFLELVEYRLNYRDIMHVDQSRAQTFVAWKLNPSGSISIMLSLSVFILFNSVLNLGMQFMTGSVGWLHYFELSHPVGVTTYIIFQVLLGYALSRLLINTKQKTKEFLKASHYFESVAPGIETAAYLDHKARIICWTGAIIVGLIIGLPLYLSLLVPQISQQVYFAMQLMIMMYISINIAETIRTYLYFDKYQQFLTKYW